MGQRVTVTALQPYCLRIPLTVEHGMIRFRARIRSCVGCCASRAASVPTLSIVASLLDGVYVFTILLGGSFFVTVIERYCG
jgi:hypothetical protein